MVALNKEKYLNALLYFISECGNEKLGIMKLNKLFYYLDFISYRDRKRSITGEKYLPFPKGPFASSLEKEITLAQKKKLLDRQQDIMSRSCSTICASNFGNGVPTRWWHRRIPRPRGFFPQKANRLIISKPMT